MASRVLFADKQRVCDCCRCPSECEKLSVSKGMATASQAITYQLLIELSCAAIGQRSCRLKTIFTYGARRIETMHMIIGNLCWTQRRTFLVHCNCVAVQLYDWYRLIAVYAASEHRWRRRARKIMANQSMNCNSLRAAENWWMGCNLNELKYSSWRTATNDGVCAGKWAWIIAD